MIYSISILRSAQKELGKLPQDIFKRVCDDIRYLAQNPRPIGCKKLIARKGWRIRVGSYRVIYEMDDKHKTVLILHIGHRRDIY